MPGLAHPRKLSLFVALSLVDLGLTRFLLALPGGSAYEWNPIASWWLDRFGWAGLAAFKLGSLALSLGLILTVARHRPHAAGRLMTLGCAALGAVIVYSGLLVPTVQADAEHAEKLDAQARRLERECDRTREYTNRIYQMALDLGIRRLTLAEAVEILSTSAKVHDPRWQHNTGARFPGYTWREVLAAVLIEEAVLCSVTGPSGAALLYRNLAAEFHSCFGRPAPPCPATEGVAETN